MWFGVEDGVVKYDGVNWAPYTEEDGILGPPVLRLSGAGDGSVYAGTGWGISRYADGRWERYFPRDGDVPWPVYDVAEARDGSLWAGTGWGALHFVDGTPTLYTSAQMGEAIRQLAPDISLSIVPDEAVPEVPWGEGIGVAAVTGNWWLMRDQSLPATVWALAPGGPGMKAGIEIGDRLVGAPSGTGNLALYSLDGKPVDIQVERKGVPDPAIVSIAEDRLEGTSSGFGVFDVFESRDGTIWFGLLDGEVVSMSASARPGTQARRWRLHAGEHGLDMRGGHPRLAETLDGVIWRTTEHGFGTVNSLQPLTETGAWAPEWSAVSLRDLGGTGVDPSIIVTRDRTLWVGGNLGHLHVLRDGGWTVYRSPDIPLPPVRTVDLVETRDGSLWMVGLYREAVRLAAGRARLRRYRGLLFQCESPAGVEWFVGREGDEVGAVRHGLAGNSWTWYGADDGLMDTGAGRLVYAPLGLVAGHDGSVWAVGSHDSVAATAHYVGGQWHRRLHTRFAEGIGPRAVCAARDGNVWFGTGDYFVRSVRGQLGGVLQYVPSRDGPGAWVHHTPPEDPGAQGPPRNCGGLAEGLDGDLLALAYWGRRLSRYDGGSWKLVRLPEVPGLRIGRLTVARDGAILAGCGRHGVYRFDGSTWIRLGAGEALVAETGRSLVEGDDGNVWLAGSTGVSRFDGSIWTDHALPVELAGPGMSLRKAADGAIWVNQGTYGSGYHTARYDPDRLPPETEMMVSADVVSQPGNTSLEWSGTDPWRDTPPEDMQFSWRLDGSEWSPYAGDTHRTLLSLDSGEHTFEVRARDRDFNVDPTPAVVRFTVVPPVWQEPWFSALVLGFSCAVALQTYRVFAARRRLLEEAEAELATAHDMQMGLMPSASPTAEGLDIAARCVPANHVGGDFYQYFTAGGTLTIAMADMSGKAMDAAIPVVMFSGVLDNQMEMGRDLAETISVLNRSMHRNLDPRSFVCLTMGEIDAPRSTLRLANAGCPYPYHFRAGTGDVVELEVGGYPLGVRPGTDYALAEVQLQPGDSLVLCSDGIIEADDGLGNQFGYGRTTSAIGDACAQGLSAQEAIERILESVAAFRGSAPQSDDMTCVVVRVL